MNVSSSTPVSAPRFSIYLFGSFESALDSKSIRFPTRKIESLLAFLVLHPEPQPREKLAALLWGDVSDEQARVSLRYALGQLRKTIGADFLIADRETVQLNPQFPIWVDAREFQIDPEQSSGDRKLQIQLYRGDLLADFYDDWILPERERYRQWYLDALLELTQQYRATSDYARAIETAQRLLGSDPANERAHQHLMFCFVAQGNRQAALNQYEQCVRALREELAVDPAPETTALYEWIKQTYSQFSSQAARITNLPIPLTSFIGREQEMAEIKGALRMRDAAASDAGGSWKMDEESTPEPPAARTLFATRLLTLTGAGGSGKTRLAIQAATDLIDAYRDGVWWVELAALADGALVPRAVANALGVRESPEQPLLDSLANFIGEKEFLLVIDNCEHLLDACSHLARVLLAECPNLQILATSREALGFIGESVQGVETLDFPDPNALSVTQLLMRYTAVRLFVERASAVSANFELNAGNASAVAQICARLDGIPLAVELAAARAKELDVKEIAAHLEDRFNFLTRGNRGALPRQQTLRALFDWSYDLLTEAERIVLRRLAVFAGGWTLEAAAQVCAGDALDTLDVIELLSHLVDKSLVEKEVREGTRYRMLETIRQYARDKSFETGEGDMIQNRHLDYFLGMAERADLELRGPKLPQWLKLLEVELDNVRAALEWSLKQDTQVGLRLVSALLWFWDGGGYLREGSNWLAQLLSQPESQAHTIIRARALGVRGYLLVWGNFAGEARPVLEESIALCRELGDRQGVAFGLIHLGIAISNNGDSSQGREQVGEGLALYRELEDKFGTAWALTALGGCIGIKASPADVARAYLEEGLPIFREMEVLPGIVHILVHLGQLALDQGDYRAARPWLEESLAIQRRLGRGGSTALTLANLGELAFLEGDYARALAYYQENLSLAKETANFIFAVPRVRLGYVALRQGDTAHARRIFEESLQNSIEDGEQTYVVNALEGLASLGVAHDQPEFAARVFAWADAMRETIGSARSLSEQSAHDRDLVTIHAQLDDAAFETAQAEGHAMSMEQVVAYALAESDA